jgi:Alpha-kinase family
VIHSNVKGRNGVTDKGPEGFDKFFETHKCSFLCRLLQLRTPQNIANAPATAAFDATATDQKAPHDRHGNQPRGANGAKDGMTKLKSVLGVKPTSTDTQEVNQTARQLKNLLNIRSF